MSDASPTPCRAWTLAGSHDNWLVALPHGLWAFVAGLMFGFIREKTDSIVPSAILHGVLNSL